MEKRDEARECREKKISTKKEIKRSIHEGTHNTRVMLEDRGKIKKKYQGKKKKRIMYIEQLEPRISCRNPQTLRRSPKLLKWLMGYIFAPYVKNPRSFGSDSDARRGTRLRLTWVSEQPRSFSEQGVCVLSTAAFFIIVTKLSLVQCNLKVL